MTFTLYPDTRLALARDAYFADSTSRVVAQAQASAEVTHAHPEGIAGAVAVAVAAARAVRARLNGDRPDLGRRHPPGRLSGRGTRLRRGGR